MPNIYNATLEEAIKYPNYTETLLRAFPKDKSIKIEDVPLVINTIDTGYPLAFIDYEDQNLLGVNYTFEDGTEHFVVINKEHIVDIQILYEQDINIFFKESKENFNDMYQ